MTLTKDEQIVSQALSDGVALMEPYESDAPERRFLALSAALAFECVITHSDDEFVQTMLGKFAASTRQFVDIYRETVRDHGEN